MLNLDPASEELTIPVAPEFLDVVSDGLLVFDAEWRCRHANRAIEALLRRSREDLLGKLAWEVLSTPERGKFATQLKDAAQKNDASVAVWTAPNQMKIDVDVLPGADAITLLLRVDYLLQFAARAAAESESRYRTVFDQSPDGMVLYGTDYRVADCNEAFAKLLRSSRSRIIGLHIDELKDQNHRDALRAALTGRVMRFDSPYETTTSGLRLWLAGTFAPLRDASGKITGAIVVVKDRTEQVMTQRALDESETQYRRLVDHLPEAIFVQIDERIAYANPAAARLLGAAGPAALVGLSLVDLAEPSRREEIRRAMQDVLEQRELIARVEQRYVCFDGTGAVDVDVVAIPFRHEGMPAILTIAFDMSSRKRVNDRLVQAQKLEGVGLVASSVAHDFNNLLLVILANAGMLLEEPDNKEAVEEMANEINAAARRGSALTRQLTFWNRGGAALAPLRIDLNDVINQEERILRRLLGRKIELSLALTDDAGSIYADPDRVGQALVNLVVNARDAAPEGSTVAIETYITRVHDHDRSEEMWLPSGAYVTLAVSDTGTGMDEYTRARIFEPFFTTKPPGKGTGLGLPIVRDVVNESGGTIMVESAPGRGTTFLIYWPCAASLSEAA
jgi:two-component system cell cycle sensor histidine kinase/response regulator CckA